MITGINQWYGEKEDWVCIDPDSMFLLTMQHGMKISNGITENLKKHNIFICLHESPDKSAFDQFLDFSILFKSELGDLEEVAGDNTTALLVCRKASEKFFKYIKESGYSIFKCGSGIYRINILIIKICIIVMSELEEPEYFWMELLIRQAGGEYQEVRINGLGCSFRIVEF